MIPFNTPKNQKKLKLLLEIIFKTHFRAILSYFLLIYEVLFVINNAALYY